jgi:hypothetical protein
MANRATRSYYAVYKGEVFVCEGTSVECSEFLGIKRRGFYRLGSPSYKKRFAQKREPNALMVIKLDGEGD